MNASSSRLIGRPKDMEKRAAILSAASQLFLELGFERATVDRIAQAAGVSKLTVYSHFADKEGLFVALIASKCDEHFEAREFVDLAPLGVREALTRIASAFLNLMFHPDVIALHRVLMTSASAETHMNQVFWDAGPAPTLAALVRLLERFDAEGALRIDKPLRAADQLFAMLKGGEHLRVLLDVGAAPDGAALNELAEDTVGMFMRAYAP
ncbi:MAG: TetR/AcrR family transcriptional regulator [Proteobacteria bacterium]|nr:TetR/AcrR family transcriptional regulator [Pseudomonadota bacterium]